MGKQWKQWLTLFWGAPKSLQMVIVAMKLNNAYSLEGKSMITLDSLLKKQRHPFADEGLYIQNYGFSSSHIQMWEFDQKEGWALKNWCFQTVVLGKTLESPLDCKKIKPVHPKGNQPWMFIGRTDTEAETPILWPPDAKSWLNGKDPDAGKDWRQEEKGGDRGWDGCMASLTQCTWVWASSRRWWRTGRPGVLQSTEVTELETTSWLNNRHSSIEFWLLTCSKGYNNSTQNRANILLCSLCWNFLTRQFPPWQRATITMAFRFHVYKEPKTLLVPI